MKTFLLLTLASLSVEASAQQQWNYPATPKIPVYDAIWGKVIQDDYRWMEETKNPDLRSWLEKQHNFTLSVLEKIPNQDKLFSAAKELEKEMGNKYIPASTGKYGTVFLLETPDNLTPQYYFRRKGKSDLELIIDPAKFIKDKVLDPYLVPISGPGQDYILFNLSEGGTENGFIKIWDVNTGNFLAETIVSPAGYFSDQKDEIFYIKNSTNDVRDPSYQKNRKLMLHKLGKPVSEDVEILNPFKYPELNTIEGLLPGLKTFNNSPYLMATKPFNKDFYLQASIAKRTELSNEKIKWQPLFVSEDKVKHDGVFLRGEKVFFLTAKDDPAFTLKSLELPHGKTAAATTVFKPERGWIITAVRETKDHLIINTLKNAVQTRTYAFDVRSGKIEICNIPLQGVAEILTADEAGNSFYFLNMGYTNTLGTYYRYDAKEKTFEKGDLSTEDKNPNLNYVVVEELEIPSHNGALVPVSLIYDKRYYKKDGKHIVKISGYGAYGFAYPPSYMAASLSLQYGMALAVARVRGGGDKGEDWHKAGFKATKPNTWKDVIAVAEYFIANNYAARGKLSVSGTSAGGILTGRSVTERPDLFLTAFPRFGAMNTMRQEFSANPTGTIFEFGTVTKKDEAGYLWEMDSYHHTKDGVHYPAQIIYAGYNDPRVPVWAPAKYAARMQDYAAGNVPQLLFVDFEGGHRGVADNDEMIKQGTQRLAFELWQSGHPDFQPKK